MLLHKLYINVAIANILLYRFTFLDLPAPRYKMVLRKTDFNQISRLVLVSLSGHIFLRKLYINVAIGNIFRSCTHMLFRTFTG